MHCIIYRNVLGESIKYSQRYKIFLQSTLVGHSFCLSWQYFLYYIVYDVISVESFNNVRKWIVTVRTHTNQDISILIVGECDLKSKREIK